MPRIVDNVRLPEHIESGARFGPTFNTSVVTFANGAEETNSNWQEELLVVDAGYGIMDLKDPDDIENSYMSILDFFRARKGRHRGFLFRDLTDFNGVTERLREVVGKQRTWQLGKSYDLYFRRITRPDPETIVIYNDGVVMSENDYTIRALGEIEFKEGVEVVNPTADFDFDIPVRFDQDEMTASITHVRAGEIPDVKIMQIRE